MSRLTILHGDCLKKLAEVPEESVHCCVTSPPYWQLRNYDCDDQIGLEKTPEEYVAKMVEVFREVWRVLRHDGTLWLNLGDSYAQSGGPGWQGKNGDRANRRFTLVRNTVPMREIFRSNPSGLKPKDLVGIPWRVALALQADGWYLRSDIIWSKPNPMPESITDRPTKTHEYIFLFAKGQPSRRTILFSDIEPEFIHFGSDLGLEPPNPRVETSSLCVRLASAFFYTAQIQYDFGLPPFYSEEWEERLNHADCDVVSALPPIHRVAAYSARFLNGKASTKEFLHKIQRTYANLRQADHLLISRSLAEGFNSPSVFVDGDATIAINDAGKVSKVDLLHGRIVTTVPTACKYFYDAEAIKEPVSGTANARGSGVNPGALLHNATSKDRASSDQKSHPTTERNGIRPKQNASFSAAVKDLVAFRNKRSVWTVTTVPYKGAHFATFPPDLIKPCIMAGTSAYGCCQECGAPWERVLGDRVPVDGRGSGNKERKIDAPTRMNTHRGESIPWTPTATETAGWQPTCECHGKLVRGRRIIPARMSKEDVSVWGADTNGEYNGQSVKNHPDDIQDSSEVKRRIIENATNDREVDAWIYESSLPLDKHPVVRCKVIDPFGGSGTTGQVSLELGRDAILIETNPEYIELIKERCNVTPGLQLA